LFSSISLGEISDDTLKYKSWSGVVNTIASEDLGAGIFRVKVILQRYTVSLPRRHQPESSSQWKSQIYLNICSFHFASHLFWYIVTCILLFYVM